MRGDHPRHRDAARWSAPFAVLTNTVSDFLAAEPQHTTRRCLSAATFPAGMSCTWDVKKTLKKHYNFR